MLPTITITGLTLHVCHFTDECHLEYAKRQRQGLAPKMKKNVEELWFKCKLLTLLLNRDQLGCSTVGLQSWLLF